MTRCGLVRGVAAMALACLSAAVSGQVVLVPPEKDLTGVLAVSPDGKTLATYNYKSGVSLRSIPGNQPIATPMHPTPGRKAELGSGGLAFSPDGKRLAMVGGSGLWVFDLETSQLLIDVGGYGGWGFGSVYAVAFLSPDRVAVLAAGAGLVVAEANPDGPKAAKVKRLTVETPHVYSKAVLAGAGKVLLLPDKTGSAIRLYRLDAEGEELAGKRILVPGAAYPAASVTIMAASPDGSIVAVHRRGDSRESSEGALLLLSTDTGTVVRSVPLTGYQCCIQPAGSFLDENRYLAYRVGDDAIRLMEGSTGAAIGQLKTSGKGYSFELDAAGRTAITVDHAPTRDGPNIPLQFGLVDVQEGLKHALTRREEEGRQAAARRDAEARQEKAEMAEKVRAAQRFRVGLKAGDESHCGLVIAIKKPIAQVQTMIGPHWLRIDQLFPSGSASCRFANGVYQPVVQ